MKKLLISLLLTSFCGAICAQNVYQKVTTSPVDWAGTYLIVCESQAVAFNGGASEASIDAKSGPAIVSGVVFADGVIDGTDALDAATFTIEASGDAAWPWAIRSASGLYIGHKDSVVADNGLSAETELKNKCMHTLSIDASGNLIATPKYAVGGEYNLQYNKKSDQMRFRYFVPGNKEAVQLYKLQSVSTSLEEKSSSAPVVKRIENGHVVIVKGNQKYNVFGKKI